VTISHSDPNEAAAATKNCAGESSNVRNRAEARDSTCTRVSVPAFYHRFPVSEFSQELIERSGYLDDQFAAVYDRYRPAPPRELLDLLTIVAQVDRPKLVVDLGCGTGLATRAWADRADDVVGVEPNPNMLARARAETVMPNVRYVEAFASETGLPEGGADLVTTWQAFHWMEPQPALAEAARLLRDGGVFAACDYDVPAFVHPEVDDAFARHFAARREARQRLALVAGASSWPKDRHVEQIAASGRFRYARELVGHGVLEADAERIVGLAVSIGGPREIFGDQAPAVESTFEELRETANRVLGDRSWPFVLPVRLRVGFK
jgi:SAM-dependent methyltransferase